MTRQRDCHQELCVAAGAEMAGARAGTLKRRMARRRMWVRDRHVQSKSWAGVTWTSGKFGKRGIGGQQQQEEVQGEVSVLLRLEQIGPAELRLECKISFFRLGFCVGLMNGAGSDRIGGLFWRGAVMRYDWMPTCGVVLGVKGEPKDEGFLRTEHATSTRSLNALPSHHFSTSNLLRRLIAVRLTSHL